jgi:hypothetical protein
VPVHDQIAIPVHGQFMIKSIRIFVVPVHNLTLCLSMIRFPGIRSGYAVPVHDGFQHLIN